MTIPYSEHIEDDQAAVLLANLVDAYDACFDPDATGTAHALGEALADAKNYLERDTVERQEIYERDGWVCQLCHEPIDRRSQTSGQT